MTTLNVTRHDVSFYHVEVQGFTGRWVRYSRPGNEGNTTIYLTADHADEDAQRINRVQGRPTRVVEAPCEARYKRTTRRPVTEFIPLATEIIAEYGVEEGN